KPAHRCWLRRLVRSLRHSKHTGTYNSVSPQWATSTTFDGARHWSHGRRYLMTAPPGIRRPPSWLARGRAIVHARRAARPLTRAAASATRSLSARASVGLRGRHAPYRRPRPVVRISGTGRLVPSVCNPSVGNRSRAARARVWALPQPSRYQAQAKRGSSKNRLERSPQATRTAFRLARARATYGGT